MTGPGGGAEATQVAAGRADQLHLQGAQPRRLRLPLRHADGRPPHRQRHVRPDRGRAAEGLPAVDREFYVMQGDFYLQGQRGDEGLRGFSMDKMLDERPGLRASSTVASAR